MIYTMKAIATTYAGVNFRSRLEAKWAAFFDIAGWPWEYEPFDMDGWAPDFMLKGAVPALVEVKPISFPPGNPKYPEGEHLIGAARQVAQKAFKEADAYRARQPTPDDDEFYFAPSRRHREVLVLGVGPFPCSAGGDGWGLGVFASESDAGGTDIARLGEGYGRALDYYASMMSFQYRIGGQYEGDHHLRECDPYNSPVAIWRQASNIVQWQAKRAAA